MHATIKNLFWQDTKIENSFLVVTASLLIALSAQITIPLTPVPATLQSFMVFLTAICLGARLASYAVLLYLIEGFSGLPVFAHAAVSLGPTSGYLIGFLCSAWLVGKLMENGFSRNRFLCLIALLLGNIALYLPGILVLTHFVGWPQAWAFGVAPFYGVCFAKILVLIVIAPFCR